MWKTPLNSFNESDEIKLIIRTLSNYLAKLFLVFLYF